MSDGNWPDSRLDDLARRVMVLENLPVVIERLSGSVSSLERSVDHLSRAVEDIKGDPVKERRAWKQAATVAIFAAVTTGVITFLIYLAAGVVK